MIINELQWIWQQADWPKFTWTTDRLQGLLHNITFKQGLLLGKGSAPNTKFTQQMTFDTLLQNIITSSAIEGEHPNVSALRSSLAKKLGVPIEQTHSVSKRSEGLSHILLDSIENLEVPLTLERLLQWHIWLFPQDQFTLNTIQAGKLRGEEPMQIVSGRLDKPIIHYEAPPRAKLDHELENFIQWFNRSRNDPSVHPLIRAAICHLWFEVIHPFEDGNGRIGRALTDLALAQADPRSIYFYAMSVSILKHRTAYYQALSNSKDLNITPWIEWFLQTLENAIDISIHRIDHLLLKVKFWQEHQHTDLSEEQRKVLNRLLEGNENDFPLGISASQYQKVAKVSKSTATRHLIDLLNKGCIEKLPGGGRNTRYQVKIRL